VRPDRIAVTPPALDDDLDFPQRVEDFIVKQLVAPTRVIEVGFGSLADILRCPHDVRFTPESGRSPAS